MTRGLGKEGRKLWRWLTARYDIADVEPLVRRMCALSDGLAALREEQAQARAAGEVERVLRLESAIAKNEAAFARLWKLTGCASVEPARPEKRRN
jgi:glycine/D-amino acid oxidase-like deaminating enzyme